MIDSEGMGVIDGLGDMLTAGLTAVGITKKRVNAVASAIGISDCGCDARARMLNEWGNKHLGIGTVGDPHPTQDGDAAR